ncbi:MAG: winged helix-turn-helix transcriptional regulator [Deltaproteobacteria bacterium]|nr:winged helix-turn-helix transcriptional regulator [Deltaproteobacteria bacterium]
MLEGVISSKTRINILVKLFLNAGMKAYLRELSSEFEVSTNAVRVELNHLTKHRILLSERDGRNVYYRANPAHPLFPELCSIVRKITGIDELVKSVVERLGNLDAVYLVGDYARGRDAGIIDIVLIGGIDKVQLDDFVQKTESYIERRIRTLVLEQPAFEGFMKKKAFHGAVKVWDRNGEECALLRDAHSQG